jgi:3-hydroxybutyrate dehydrogenase
MAERPLAGLSALVTGSTSGIGLGIARALADAGSNVTLNGLGDRLVIEATRAGLEAASGVEVGFTAADLSRPAEVERMIADAEDRFGKVDILVNNAGIFHVGPTDGFAPTKWQATLDINLSAAFVAVRSVLPGMKSRGWGRIINVASALGLVGARDSAAYAASKHGVVGLTRSVALEVAEAGITVNAICPGYVMTALIEHEVAEAVRMRRGTAEEVRRGFLAETQPTHRFVETSEIGALVAFLCGPAGNSITGAAIPIDGGWTAR